MMDMMEQNMTDYDYDMEQNTTDLVGRKICSINEFGEEICDSDGRMISEMITSIVSFVGSMGHFGQISVVWFSIGIAMWQLLAIGRNLLTSGEKVESKSQFC